LLDRRGWRSRGAEIAVIYWLRNITGVRRTICKDEGQTLVEYTLVLMLVALIAISPLSQIGVWVWNALEPIADAL